MERNLIVIACGGRDYSDRDHVHRSLAKLLPRLNSVIQGEARGADSLARNWAVAHGVDVIGFRANWDKYGKAAGMRRNREMLDQLLAFRAAGRDVGVVAFPGGVGTAGMCQIAENAGVKVWRP